MQRWLPILFVAFPAVAQDLLPGPGQAETAAACAGCHTLGYIRLNAPFLTQAQWKAEVAKMRTAFGAQIDDATAAAVLAYLSATYAAPP